MSKNIENDYKTKPEPKHLSGAMVTVYCPDSDILILKCQCCNKVVAYCCHCNPILQSLSETNSNRASIDSNRNATFTNNLHHNVVVPIFDINHNTNSNSLTNNIKKTNTVLENTSSLDNAISLVANSNEVNNIAVDSNEVVTDSKTNKLEDEIQHTVVENSITTQQQINNLENNVNKQDTTQKQANLDMMHFCYKVETKLGELNLGANHYQVLELNYKATRLEIQNSYLRLLSEFSISKIKNIFLPEYNLEAQVNLIIEAINKAAKTLLNSSLRNQYDKEIFEELNKNIIIDNKINNDTIYNKVILSHNTSNNQNSKNNDQKNNTYQTNLSEQFNSLIIIDKAEKPIVSLPPKLNKPVINIDNNYSISPKKVDPRVEKQNSISSNNSYINSQLLSENNVEVDIEAEVRNEGLVSEQSSLRVIQATPAVKVIDNKVERRKPITGYMIKPGELKNAREESPIANDLYALSLKCYETLNYERAINPLQKALELNPNNAIYWFQLGKTYSKIHNYQHRAESAYKEAVRICPDNIEYLTELATLYKNLGKTSQAGEIFQTIFQLKYQNSVFYQKLKGIIVKFSSSRERKHKASQERQNNLKLKIAGYFKSLADWLSLLFIVISYKLSSQKISSTSKQTDK